MKPLIIILALTLGGCATPPKWLATMYDNQDPCQKDPYLQYCGAAGSVQVRSYVRSTGTYVRGYTRTAPNR